MSKIITWVLGFTKFGKINDAVKGYRGAAVFLATGLGVIAKVVLDATDKGIPYLITPEAMTDYKAIGLAFGGFYACLKGVRIEKALTEQPK